MHTGTRHRTLLRSALALAAALVCAAAEPAHPGSAPAEPPRADSPVVVVPAPGAARWVGLLRASGASARAGSTADALERRAGVVPAGARLSPGERAALVRLVRSGGRLVVADDGLLAALGVRRGRPRAVRTVREDGLEPVVRWTSARLVRPLAAGPGARLRPLAAGGGAVVLAAATVGRGTVLAVAVDPFAPGLTGHETFPALGRRAAEATGAPPGPRRDAVEIYLDPGNVTGTPEELAARLAGYRAVYVAAWAAGHADPSFDYPYDRLIAALHAHGVLAYAWLEPPFVDDRTWTEHPECREKQAGGSDAVDGWRRLVALEDTRCFELAWSAWRSVLERFDFDGVDVAELYYASTSMPYHPSALAQFGGDPARRPAAWLGFREALVERIDRAILERLRALDPSRDRVLTVIDDRLDPKIARRIGSDVDRLASVARATAADLQIEDPYTTWTRGPARYDVVDRTIAATMPRGRAFADVNVVPREYAYPTPTMTAAELDLSIANAGRHAGRIALYAAGTIVPGDEPGLTGALAAAAVTGVGSLAAPWTTVVQTPDARLGRLSLDGRAWPARGGRALVPPGRHAVRWLAGRDDGPALVRLSGELIDEHASGGVLMFTYRAGSEALAVVAGTPRSARVDGLPAPGEAAPGPEGGSVLRLPAGAHRVEIRF